MTTKITKYLLRENLLLQVLIMILDITHLQKMENIMHKKDLILQILLVQMKSLKQEKFSKWEKVFFLGMKVQKNH